MLDLQEEGGCRWRAFASGRVWSSPSDIGDDIGVYGEKGLYPTGLTTPHSLFTFRWQDNAGISGLECQCLARAPTVWIQDWLQPEALLHRSKVGIGHTGELIFLFRSTVRHSSHGGVWMRMAGAQIRIRSFIRQHGEAVDRCEDTHISSRGRERTRTAENASGSWRRSME